MKRIMTLLIFLIITTGYADQIPPVDITLLMVEIKYNEEQGIKICEIQPVSHSVFEGYDSAYHKTGFMGQNLCDFMSQFETSIWFVENDVRHQQMKLKFVKNGWISFKNKRDLFQSVTFLETAAKAVNNPYNISDYHGIVYLLPGQVDDKEKLLQKFPGIIFIDLHSAKHCKNKHTMSSLFTEHPILINAKPKWNIYPAKYSPELANQIISDIGSDLFVIKPKDAYNGNGVIMVAKEDLDETLKTILNPTRELRNHPDRGYKYWSVKGRRSFIVEEFIQSKLIEVPEVGDGLFDCTMRFAVALLYYENVCHLHFLGQYWNLPDIPMESEGSLSQKHRTSLTIQLSAKVDPETREKAYELLTTPLIMLYKRMLGFPLDQLEEGLDSAVVTSTQEKR